MHDFQTQMLLEGRCIFCGAKCRGRYECRACYRTQVQTLGHGGKRDFNYGARQFSMHHEYCRRLGYSSYQQGAPHLPGSRRGGKKGEE